MPCSLKYPAATSEEAVKHALAALIDHHKSHYVLQDYRVLSRSRTSVLFECLFLDFTGGPPA